MKESLIRPFRVFFTEPQWEKVRDVFWFFVITLVFHLAWRIWANDLHYAPIHSFIAGMLNFMVHRLFDDTTYILRHILNVTIYTEPQIIITKNNIRLLLSESAAGLKQICQFAVLILLFHGNWKHKAWFIPAGIIVLHLTNIARIISMVIIAMHWPLQIQYAHDNWLRILYYVVIFVLWLIWVEKVAPKKGAVEPEK
jgi:exosortase/archaeosortase family protein